MKDGIKWLIALHQLGIFWALLGLMAMLLVLYIGIKGIFPGFFPAVKARIERAAASVLKWLGVDL